MCVFCEIVKKNIPSYKIYENSDVVAILDLSQATLGHTLIIPKLHSDNILSLNEESFNGIMKACKEVTSLLKEKLNVTNFNILNNCGTLAGQTVMHFHIHVIPRYEESDITIKFHEHNITNEYLENVFNKITLNK